MVKMNRSNALNVIEDQTVGKQDIISSSSSGTKSTMHQDTLTLHSSEHPGMNLVSNPLTGNNYIPWARSMKIALSAKMKLGFINGKVVAPDVDFDDYENWKRVNDMVLSWILNSISKDIVENFLYHDVVKDLWDELSERFGESNGPLLYQMQRQIISLHQGNDSVATYYSKLKRLGDEYSSLTPSIYCCCDASKLLAEKDLREKLIQFLMGLNESYESTKSQILLMDPLPSVNKVYAMIQRIEKQRDISIHFPMTTDHSAMFNKAKQFGKFVPGKIISQQNQYTTQPNTEKGRQFIRRSKEEKAKFTCDYCQGTGHEATECFKLHGYPDWYKDLRAQRAQQQSANVTERMEPHNWFGISIFNN